MKTDKQLLFERMEQLNPEFNVPEQLDEAVSLTRAVDKVKDGFNIQEWDSPEGVEARKKIANDIGTLYKKAMGILQSTISNEQKAKAIKVLLTGSAIAATIIAIWNGLHPDVVPLIDQEFTVFGRDFNVELGKELGRDFSDMWDAVKIALFFVASRVVHSILVAGHRFKEKIKGIGKAIALSFAR